MATPQIQNPYRPFQTIQSSTNPIDNAVNPFAAASPLQTGYQPPNSTTGLPGGTPSGAANIQPKSGIQNALDFLGTPGGAAVTNFAGAGLQAYGNYQQNQQNLQQDATKFAATTAQNQFNVDRTNQMNRATGVLNADPLGADQKYAQRNALDAAILPNLRNARSTPGDAAVASAMGGNRGGIMNALPENGLDPAMVNSMFGPNATAAAITQRHQEINSLDPNAAQPNMQALFGPQAAPYQQQMADWASKLQGANAQTRAAYDQQMKGYIDHMVSQESDTGGFWHTFAKIAGVVGAAAATIMTAGGASPLLTAAIGAGAGAASSWGNGGNPLSGAILGGASGYAGAKLKGNE